MVFPWFSTGVETAGAQGPVGEDSGAAPAGREGEGKHPEDYRGFEGQRSTGVF